MTIKSDQIFFSRAPHRTFEGEDCNVLFIPDRRKGGALSPNGQKLMLGVHQRKQLEAIDVLVHNNVNKEQIKQKMKGTLLEIHEFPDSLKVAGFGAGLLVKKETGDVLMPDDIISLVDSSKVLSMLKEPIEVHNNKILEADNELAMVGP